MRFDDTHRRRDLDHDPSTARYREIITNSDLLVFIYPIWWSGMPAILKGFIDRVFMRGFAYEYKGMLPHGLLAGKKAWIITTDDTPGLFARFFQDDYGKVLRTQTLKMMCGIPTLKHSQLHYMRGSSGKKRARFLEKVREFARNVRV